MINGIKTIYLMDEIKGSVRSCVVILPPSAAPNTLTS